MYELNPAGRILTSSRVAALIAVAAFVVRTAAHQGAEDAVKIRVTCNDGRVLDLAVDHAIGSTERPMTEADLRAKFHGLVDPVLGAARADAVTAAFDRLETSGELRGLVALTQ